MNELLPTVAAMLTTTGPTAPLADFRADYEADDNLWWRIGCGHHQNLLRPPATSWTPSTGELRACVTNWRT